MSHVPGKSMLVADMLCRAPLPNPADMDTSLEQGTAAYVNTLVQSLPATEKQLDRIKQHQEEDEVCQQVMTYCRSGWPPRHEVAGAASLYCPMSSELSVDNGLLMPGSRIVIPTALRLEMLDK